MPNVCECCGAEYDTAHTCGGVPLLSRINDMPLALKRIGELEAENAKLREENIALGGASTMTACKRCNRGVRPRYAVKGMCAECARARIAELEDEKAALEVRFALAVELADIVDHIEQVEEDCEHDGVVWNTVCDNYANAKLALDAYRAAKKETNHE